MAVKYWEDIEIADCFQRFKVVPSRFVGAIDYDSLKAEHDRLTQENERLKAGSWRPIETAPKDGRTILVFKYTPPGWSIVGLAFWFGGDSGIQGWMSYGIPQLASEPNTLGLAHPTHWMPLPAAPEPVPSHANHMVECFPRVALESLGDAFDEELRHRK